MYATRGGSRVERDHCSYEWRRKHRGVNIESADDERGTIMSILFEYNNTMAAKLERQ